MNIHSRILPLFAVLSVAAIAVRTALAADDPSHVKNPAGALSVEEIQRLVEKLPANVKGGLIESADSTLVFAYLGRDDDTALANGRWLLMIDPEKAEESLQAEAIISELHRRQTKGTFGKKPLEKLPAEFGSWSVARKLSFLIDALDEIDDFNVPMHFFSPASEPDWRIKGLADISDAAVPSLIDAIEHDERLTRMLEPNFNRFKVSRKVLSVRKAALDTVLSIIRVRHLDPTEEESFFKLDSKANIQKVVQHLRVYWTANSGLPLDERMMKVLTNPKASDEACREAASNLTSSSGSYSYGPLGIEIRPSEKAPPAIAKFQNPTVGEAILTVIDRVSREHGSDPKTLQPGFDRRHLGFEEAYLGRLVELHDKRLLPEFVRRFKSASTFHARLVWAVAANADGDAAPIKELADEFRDGKLTIPTADPAKKSWADELQTPDLMRLVGCLARIDLPETNRSLFAAADPKHPLHDRIAKEIATSTPWTTPEFNDISLDHPYCLAFLRHDLDDHTPTGATYQIGGSSYGGADSFNYSMPDARTHTSTGMISEIPDFLRDPAKRRERAPELVCDRAADLIDKLVFGMPEIHVHPLSKDHDERLREMILQFDRFHGRFRRMTEAEAVFRPDIQFIADIALHGKPATAEDVKFGRAVFSLAGPSKPAPIKLPAVGIYKQGQKKSGSEHVVIVQAEIDTDGKTVYGIIGRHFIRVAKAEELSDVKPIDSPAN